MSTAPHGLPDWRDAGAYEGLAGIDRAGLMWEWLRRDPGYVAWYTRASTATCGGDPSGEAARRWGLHFRRGPGSCRARRPGDLAR